ncbi:MAG: CopG family transcriptional regulator [Chloroflexota bacterium]|nr:CopG family transcriptional regulator [Chloroflexota bacterium]
MDSTAITLTEQEQLSLRTIAQQTGKTPDELLHEAITQFLTQFQQTPRRALLQQARGMWKDRTDLPSLATLRHEFDRTDP